MGATLDPHTLLDALFSQSITRLVGVPDSTLQDFIVGVDGDPRFHHLLVTNECEATAIAAGQYLASGIPSLVYFQNSGFGKTIHPITSILAPECNHIPALFLIGHRGDPNGKPDEPQHRFMGRIMTDLLDAIEVPYDVLSPDNVPEVIDRAIQTMAKTRRSHAFIVRPGLFTPHKRSPRLSPYSLSRRDAIRTIVECLPEETIFVSTTGKASRELYALRDERHESHDRDFHTVGGMGHASAIALGIASVQPDRRICVIDGDGAALMKLSTWADIGRFSPPHFTHILIDNEAHESTGGQPTLTSTCPIHEFAKIAGYAHVELVHTSDELLRALRTSLNIQGPCLIAIKVNLECDPKLGRPTLSADQHADHFKRHLLRR